MAAYSQKWHNGTSRTRSTETSDGLAAIQTQLNNIGREIKKVNEKVYAAQVGCEQCKGPHYTKDCPQKEEGKTLEESYYTQFGGPFQSRGYRATAPGFYQRNNANPSKNQGNDLMPTIEEGEVIEEFRTRDEDLDTRIDDCPSYCNHNKKIHVDCAHNLKFSCMVGFEFTHANFFPLLYVTVMSKKFHNSIMKEKLEYKGNNVVGALMNVPIFVGTFFVMTDFAVLEDMDAYRDEGMGDVIVGELFLREVGIKARRFEGMITIYDGNNEVTYQMVQSHPRFKRHTNKQCNKIPPLLKVSEEDEMNGISYAYQKLKGFYKGVLNLGPDYIRDEKTEEWLTRGHISFEREDQKLYKFKEGDFQRLNLRDIEYMLLLLVQKKIANLKKDFIFDFNVALRMIGISKRTPYTAYNNPQGIIYVDKFKRNRLMRSDELYKFSDGTLTSVRYVLHDIASNLRMDYLPKRIWSNLEKQRSRVMIKAIDKLQLERRLMRNLEKFVGRRDYREDFRLLERTI
ncbi:hypothetical protein Tco_1393772 [Tanacetum coccineum]